MTDDSDNSEQHEDMTLSSADAAVVDRILDGGPDPQAGTDAVASKELGNVKHACADGCSWTLPQCCRTGGSGGSDAGAY